MSTRREDLEAAFEQAEKNESEQPAGGITNGSEAPEKEAGGPGTEDPKESVRASGEEKESDGTEKPVKSPQELLDDKTPIKEDRPAPTASAEDRAPAGWAPSVREKWNDLPAEVKAEIVRRERGYATGIQRYAETSKYGEEMRKIIEPFRNIIQMEGADDHKAVQNLIRYGAVMRLGTPAQKAAAVRDIINTYAVDIQTLDNLLAGEPAVTPEEERLRSLLDNRLKPVEELLTTVRSAREEVANRSIGQIDEEIARFEADPANEFLSDVKEDMADILEVAARRGQRMTLQDAYKKAVAMNDEVQKVIQARSNRGLVERNRGAIERKKAAATSLSAGRPRAVSEKAAETRRGALEAAWEAHS